MNKAKIFTVVCFGVLAGFCAGTGMFVQACRVQRYAAYGLHRLMLLELTRDLNLSVLSGIAVFLGGCCLLWALYVGLKRAAGLSGFGTGAGESNRWCAAAAGILFWAACSGAGMLLFAAAPERVVWCLASLGAAALLGLVSAAPVPALLSRAAKASALGVLLLVLLSNLLVLLDPAVRRLQGPNIVLVVIDCMRADHAGCSGYTRPTTPVMDALARRGRLYRRAYANAPWTKPSVASLFTSLHPTVHNVINAGSTMDRGMLTLAEVLRNRGYRTGFFNGGNVFLKPEFRFDQGFETYVYRPHRSSNAASVTGDFIRNVMESPGKRFFAYLHYMDAHTPYTVHEHNYLFTDRTAGRFEPGNRQSGFNRVRALIENNMLGETDREHIAALYDAQLRFVDENLGVVVGFLRRQGLLRNTVLIITSDHGEELFDHGSFEHGHTLYNELLHVPLIIAGAGVPPGAVAEPVRLIDLAPTVLTLAGEGGVPEVFQGTVLPGMPGSTARSGPRPVFAGGTLFGSEKYCLIQGDDKLIRNSTDTAGKWTLVGPAAGVPAELYDLAGDPGERHNLAADGRTGPAAAERLLEQFISRAPLFQRQDEVAVVDAEMRERLEALGYVR